MKRIVFIPGLGHEQKDDLSAKTYAHRLMKAIDENNPNHSKKYRIEVSEEKYDEEGTLSNIVDIYEIDKNEEEKIYNIYEFKYGDFLTKRYIEANIFIKFFSLLLVLISRFKSVITSLFFLKKEFNKETKFQAIYFLIIYILLSIYLLFLFPSILAMIVSILGDIGLAPNLAESINSFKTYIDFIVVTFSAFMFLNPNTKSLFSNMATEYLAANQYLTIAEQQQLIVGKLSRLVEYISEQSEEEVDIEFHSYSFGSVIAIDTLFPFKTQASIRVQTRVKKLITIGCPFDFIEIYWEEYFSNRNVDKSSLSLWLNVTSELDVLSTKFIDTQIKNETFISSKKFWEDLNLVELSYDLINPQRVSFLQKLLFYGLRVHEMYWDKNLDSKSCLNDLVKEL